ncbi:MAG: PIN domain-containing protein [Methanoregula sp.]|nr:PIN domain-containing protein [Methanoregula sp.]
MIGRRRRRIPIAYLLDSWVWIAHFEGGSEEAQRYVEGREDLCMSAITIAEVAQKYSNHGEKIVESRINDMLNRCPMIPVDRRIATLAGMLRHREIHGGIADAIILATARIGHHTIVTGDQHFRDLPGVVFINHL